MTARDYRVYPVPGRFITGIPATVTLCATKKEADELVKSGAFTYDRPADALDEAPAPSETLDEPTEAEPDAETPTAADEAAPEPEEA